MRPVEENVNFHYLELSKNKVFTSDEVPSIQELFNSDPSILIIKKESFNPITYKF